MLDHTDRHCRFFLRLISQHARLTTEMVVAQAVVHGDRSRLLDFHPSEKPLTLQLGGSDAQILAQACAIATDWGYDEINLNVGCPSNRVQKGAFGACLMKDPAHVVRLVQVMRQATRLPVSVKCRIGVDDQIPQKTLPTFVRHMQDAGVHTFIIHARKAWLAGLSPRENRMLPPLDYPLVMAIKERFPHLRIILNGGLESPLKALPYLQKVDGVMLGRSIIKNPYALAEVDNLFFQHTVPSRSRAQVAHSYVAYMATQNAPLWILTRPLLGLFDSMPGAKKWRMHLAQAHSLTDVENTIEQITRLHPFSGINPVPLALFEYPSTPIAT